MIKYLCWLGRCDMTARNALRALPSNYDFLPWLISLLHVLLARQIKSIRIVPVKSTVRVI
jgi:hypothetical protein